MATFTLDDQHLAWADLYQPQVVLRPPICILPSATVYELDLAKFSRILSPVLP